MEYNIILSLVSSHLPHFQQRSELLAAQDEVARGNILRQQLEERMRRTILQGMTAMNIETMSLFNNTEK